MITSHGRDGYPAAELIASDVDTVDDGGEGSSLSGSFLASPTLLSETLSPTGLLTVSLLLSAMLVVLVTATAVG